MRCECSDPGCPCCKGQCKRGARRRLYRIDMEDYHGTPMCPGCTEDAMESGLFITGREFAKQTKGG